MTGKPGRYVRAVDAAEDARWARNGGRPRGKAEAQPAPVNGGRRRGVTQPAPGKRKRRR